MTNIKISTHSNIAETKNKYRDDSLKNRLCGFDRNNQWVGLDKKSILWSRPYHKQAHTALQTEYINNMLYPAWRSINKIVERKKVSYPTLFTFTVSILIVTIPQWQGKWSHTNMVFTLETLSRHQHYSHTTSRNNCNCRL